MATRSSILELQSRQADALVVGRPRARAQSLAHALSDLGFSARANSRAERRLDGGRPVLTIVDAGDDVAFAMTVCCRLKVPSFPLRAMLVVAPDRKSATHAKLLEAGADQVVGKPYSPRELRASVVAVLRRIRSRDQREEPTRGAALAPPTVQTLDELALALHLTETERRLLRCMIAKPDGVSASALLSTVFPGLHYGPDSSHVRVHIHRLRRKLEPVGLVVKGMRGYGYRVFRGRTASNLLHAGAWTTM